MAAGGKFKRVYFKTKQRRQLIEAKKIRSFKEAERNQLMQTQLTIRNYHVNKIFKVVPHLLVTQKTPQDRLQLIMVM
jgi:hypothetical protein